MAAHRAGDLAAAEAGYRASFAAAPNWPAAYNLGLVLARTGRPDEALVLWRQALALQPDAGPALSALGAGLLRTQALDEAAGLLQRAHDLAPQDDVVAYRLGHARLMQGRLAEGWPLYERREPRRNAPTLGLSFPEWTGEPLAGKSILVWGEQGLGDELQFARFVPRLRELGAAKVSLGVHPTNARLFEQLGADTTFGNLGKLQTPRHDHWVLLGSLPHRLGATLQTLPAPPYLNAPPRSAGGRVGVMARANALGHSGSRKTLPEPLAARLLALPGAVSLEPGKTGARDMRDTAEIVAGLDLVIAVDTAVAHLAGAMGKPVWILLPFLDLDWRWLTARDDSPWYPSARLFRQGPDNDWTPVVEAVVAAFTGLPATAAD